MSRLISVKLLGGPMSGRTVEVPASAEQYRVGRFWTYLPAGQDGGQTVFAIRQPSRLVRRAVRAMVSATGRHPAVEADRAQEQPHRGRARKEHLARRRHDERVLRAAQASWRALDGYSGR